MLTSPDYRYADRPLPGGTAKIDRRRSISIVDGRLREKKKEERRRRGEENLLSPSCPRPRPVAALARGRFFSRVRRRNVSLCGEKDRGDIAPFF
ncbi:hypothetical protein GW17_00023477 [Ensete ventricosum]|nr:hypothetical protein GW17_00023477 [Ensete ventricosum]RZR99872.1 hypothetical protein BHM03_00029497 [Ensete ventricosum]